MADQDPIDLGDANTPEIQIPLEDKYSEQMRQIVSQKIELPISTISEMIKEQIDLDPAFQRRDRWDRDKQSRFIESIIMNVPIPPVFLGEDEYGKYVVLDGRQRLTAINDFFKNLYALKGLAVWKELNGLTFNDLQKKKFDRYMMRRFIPAIVILKESSTQVKYDVFDRLNTGGVIAEPMEIRNAIFQGEFNRQIHNSSDNQTFRKLWNIPLDEDTREQNTLYQKMLDLELVLRFFALQQYGSMNLNFKDYLSDYMRQRNADYKAQPTLATQDSAIFETAVTNCWKVFGEDAFRKPSPEGLSSKKSAPLADAIMFALCRIDPPKITNRAATAVRDAIYDLCLNNEDFKKATGTGTNGKGAIKTRLESTKAAVLNALNSTAA